jgi:hypothetical protein
VSPVVASAGSLLLCFVFSIGLLLNLAATVTPRNENLQNSESLAQSPHRRFGLLLN